MPCSHSHHHHALEHGHTPDSVRAANISHFDSRAHTYAHSAAHQTLAKHVTAALLAHLPLTDTTTLLDYACGPGSLSQALAPHVARIVGVDISPKMVEAFNAAVHNQGIPPEEMRAVVGDLTADAELVLGVEESGGFDVGICSLALHHMPDAAAAVNGLVRRVKVGGCVAVVEFAAYEEAGREEREGVVSKKGFTEEELRGMLEAAGCAETAAHEVGPGGGKGFTLVRKSEAGEGGEVQKVERKVFMMVGKRVR